jgi:NADPH-dependent F420 reductase
MNPPLALVGGTGPEGLGLALRFAVAGQPVLIGSRAVERARAAAEKVRAVVPGAQADGYENLDAVARTDRVFLTLPFVGLADFLAAARPALAGKLVVDVVVPLALRHGFAEIVDVPGARSAGELVQQTLPSARVVSAFKTVAAARLADLGLTLAEDVILCGDDADARTVVAGLVGMLPGLRAVDAGRIANACYLEAATALLLNLNRRHRAQTGLTIVGLPPAGR